MNDVLSYQTRLRQKLTEAFAPSLLEIKDDSKKHAGHGGYHDQGETHFVIVIVSEKFAGLGLVARHRLVYDALKEELSERVHALTLSAKTPSES